jgi:hypothetical protein
LPDSGGESRNERGNSRNRRVCCGKRGYRTSMRDSTRNWRQWGTMTARAASEQEEIATLGKRASRIQAAGESTIMG